MFASVICVSQNDAMPTFYVTFADDRHAPYVPLEQMAKVIADTPLEAAASHSPRPAAR